MSRVLSPNSCLHRHLSCLWSLRPGLTLSPSPWLWQKPPHLQRQKRPEVWVANNDCLQYYLFFQLIIKRIKLIFYIFLTVNKSQQWTDPTDMYLKYQHFPQHSLLFEQCLLKTREESSLF